VPSFLLGGRGQVLLGGLVGGNIHPLRQLEDIARSPTPLTPARLCSWLYDDLDADLKTCVHTEHSRRMIHGQLETVEPMLGVATQPINGLRTLSPGSSVAQPTKAENNGDRHTHGRCSLT
jgi:hypothetical protein